MALGIGISPSLILGRPPIWTPASEGADLQLWFKPDAGVTLPAAPYADGGMIQDGSQEAAGVAMWDVPVGTLTKETGTPHGGSKCLRITGTNPYARQLSTLVTGNVYRVRGYCRSDGTCLPKLGSGAFDWTGTSSTDWQAIDYEHTATGAHFTIGHASGTGFVEYDDVTVEPLSPSAWADQSGKARHVTQATAARRFAFDADGFGTGKPSVYANGVGDATYQYMLSNTFTAVNQPLTWYLVLGITLDANARSFFDGQASTTGREWLRLSSGSTDVWAGTNSNPGVVPNGNHILCIVYNGASSALYVDNVQLGSNINPKTNGLSQIGLGNHLGASMPKGHYGDVLMFSGAHDSAKRTQVYNYLKARYGL